MRIKVIIVSPDEVYLERAKRRLAERYYTKIQPAVFTELQEAEEKARAFRPDIILVDEELDYESVSLPKRCSLAVLTRQNRIQSIGSIPAIGRYQALSTIVSNLLDVYADRAEKDNIHFEGSQLQKKIVTFFPSAGGVGSSTLAAAYSLHLAKKGEKVLYLNLEHLGVADLYFRGDPSNNLGKVLYALQMDSPNTANKLENALNRSKDGVLFYSGFPVALDYQDFGHEQMEQLFENLSKIESFDWIVVDMDFSLSTLCLHQVMRSDVTVFVSDGSFMANYKLKRISEAVDLWSKNESTGKLMVMYNRFSSKSSSKAKDTIFTEAGGIGRIENAEREELLNIISMNPSFKEIL